MSRKGTAKGVSVMVGPRVRIHFPPAASLLSPLAYGTVEIMIGLSAIFGAIERAPHVVEDPATSLLLIQLAAGMYIIVRGIDNCAQAKPWMGGVAAFRWLWESIGARSGRKRKE
jgi:hypothetical protein